VSLGGQFACFGDDGEKYMWRALAIASGLIMRALVASVHVLALSQVSCRLFSTQASNNNDSQDTLVELLVTDGGQVLGPADRVSIVVRDGLLPSLRARLGGPLCTYRKSWPHRRGPRPNLDGNQQSLSGTSQPVATHGASN
jgi:hypothetical protein